MWLVLDGQLERTQLPLVSVLALSAFSPVTRAGAHDEADDGDAGRFTAHSRNS